MSLAGHGVRGLRSNLRSFSEFIDSSDTQKQVLCELRSGYIPTSWYLTAVSGVYRAFLNSFTFNDIFVDVVGVQTATGPLIRVQTQAECEATVGTFFFDPDQAPPIVVAVAKWDGADTWNGSHVWDEGSGPLVYVHPATSVNPTLETVSVEFGFYFANYGETHPTLSDELLTNGNFEAWASASDATGWTEAVSTAAMTVSQETVNIKSGTYAVKLAAVSNVAAEQYAEESVQLTNLVVGKTYRLSGDYLTSKDVIDAGTTRPCILVGSTAGGTYIPRDGLNATATGSYWAENPTFLNATGGEWRRFAFDFVASHTTMQIRLRHEKQTGTLIANSYTVFDNVSLRRVWRYVTYEPALSSSSIPATETGSNDVFFGGKRIGSGSITLDNAGGRLERVIGQLDWLNKNVYVSFGGQFADGQDVLYDDCRRGFTGLTQAVSINDQEVRFDMEDVRIFFHIRMPPATYDDVDLPNLDSSFQGKAKPLFFGVKENITPIRIDYASVPPGLGIYEIADCSLSPVGLYALTALYAYENSEAAARRDSSRRLTSSYVPTMPVLTTTGGSTGSNTHFKMTASTGWGNAGAKAVAVDDTFSGAANIIAEVTAGDGVWMLGVTSNNADWSYSSLNFALYSTGVSGNYHVYENGADTFTSAVIVEVGDVLQIRFTDGIASYWINGTLIYTSIAVPSAVATYNIRVSVCNTASMVGGIRLRRETSVYHTADLANGRFTLNYDVGPYRVEDGKNRAVFYQGADKTFKIPPGLYTARELRIMLSAACAVAGSDVNYESGYLNRAYTLSNASVSFYPKISSGAEKGLWSVFGFTGADRLTGNTHAGNVTVFDDTDTHSILRVDASGYADDGSGTYTGVAGALIERGDSILRYLFTRILKKSAGLIDETSFDFAAGRAPEALALYIDESTTTKEVFDTLEYSNVANIVVDGEGRIYYLVYIGDVPAGILDIYDYDFLSFEAVQAVTDVYHTVKVYFDEDPTLGTFEGRASEDSSTLVRFGRPDYREFFTYVKIANNAQSLADRLCELAKRPPRKIRFTTKSKLIDKKVGDKIRLTRSRAFDAAGKLNAQVVRILSLAHDYRTGISTCECVDDVVTVAGVVCISNCQSTCEFACQTGCEAACQSTCEATCQQSCEASCQQACELGCQASCQLGCQNCQTACEATCQACQTVCQTACQVACQTTCQLACQTGCQVSCQYTCQVACQTGCEVACQQACESTCQTGCEVSCQTGCEVSCETVCQWECQTASERKGY